MGNGLSPAWHVNEPGVTKPTAGVTSPLATPPIAAGVRPRGCFKSRNTPCASMLVSLSGCVSTWLLSDTEKGKKQESLISLGKLSGSCHY